MGEEECSYLRPGSLPPDVFTRRSEILFNLIRQFHESPSNSKELVDFANHSSSEWIFVQVQEEETKGLASGQE